jgi:hypothetical protein
VNKEFVLFTGTILANNGLLVFTGAILVNNELLVFTGAGLLNLLAAGGIVVLFFTLFF